MSPLLHLFLLAYTFHLLSLLPTSATSSPGIMVTISDVQNNNENNLHSRFHTKDIMFQGSHIQGIALHTTDDEDDYNWSITAPLIYAIPNSGSTHGLMNSDQIRDTIVVFDRAETVSIAEQMNLAQQAGAAAVIILDSPHAHEKKTALRAALDANSELWHSLTIPSVVISYGHGERLRTGMKLVRGDVGHGYGEQYVMEGSNFAEWIQIHQQHTMRHDEL